MLSSLLLLHLLSLFLIPAVFQPHQPFILDLSTLCLLCQKHFVLIDVSFRFSFSVISQGLSLSTNLKWLNHILIFASPLSDFSIFSIHYNQVQQVKLLTCVWISARHKEGATTVICLIGEWGSKVCVLHYKSHSTFILFSKHTQKQVTLVQLSFFFSPFIIYSFVYLLLLHLF